MATRIPYHDGLYRLAQVGMPTGLQLLRIGDVQEGNRYSAQAIEFDDDGETQPAEDVTITVTNLAEPADVTGQIPNGTDATALDVEGRWIVFLRREDTASFPAKVVSSQGSATYTMREQAITTQGSFINKPGTTDFSARNLAELSLGPGAAVDDGTIVLIVAMLDNDSPPNLHYLFDHPAYAKYLD